MPTAEAGGWTVETLRQYVEAQLAGVRRENDDRDRLLVQIMDERHAANLKALDKAEDAAAARHDALVNRLDLLATTVAVDQGKGQGLATGWALLLGAIAALGTLVSLAVLFIQRG